VYEEDVVAKTIMVDVPKTVQEEVSVPKTVYDTVQKTVQETIPRVTYERVARETSVWNPVSGARPLGAAYPYAPLAGLSSAPLAPLPGTALGGL
jgi:hypothetical protein